MALNVKCPRCGSTHVQMSNEKSRHGCLFTILFGVWYLAVVIMRWCIALILLCFIDWWMWILKSVMGKGYTWQFTKWTRGSKRTYYCHNCGYNFRG